jgi:glycosyltransferase involved in cell wall biosynthesis
LDNRVFFVGPQYGLAKEIILRQADAFVLPSYCEGLPMAALEAWAYAKPVLMTPACNLAIGYDRNAAIRIDHDPMSIAEGLRRLLEMKSSELKRLGDNGHKIALQEFSWPSVAAKIKSVYTWLIGGGSAPDCVIRS